MQNYLLTTLASGARAISEPLDSVRSVALGLWIGTGSRDEDDAHAGVTHFLEHLLFKGSQKYSAVEIAEVFDGFGGELNAATARDYTVVYARVLDEHVEEALDVMTDIVFAPSLVDLDSEREVVLEEIAMIEDTPQEVIHDLLTQAVFGNHPLGRPVLGSADVIANVSRRSISAYHRARYTAANVVAAAAGNLPHERFVELLDGIGEKLRPTSRRPAARAPWVSAPAPRLAFQRKNTEQYHLCLGAPGISRSDKRRFTASILDGILGGSASSRLFQEIREKRGLAYTVYTFSSQYADTGQIGVYVGTREENLATVPRDRGRADRGGRGRRHPRRRARPREGEPQGPDHALHGADLEPHEPPREVARHGQRASRPRPDRRGDRRRRRGRRGGADRDAARARAPLRRGDRAEREARSPRRRAGLFRPRLRQSGVKVLLYGSQGKVGSVLGPKLAEAGHEVTGVEVGERPSFEDQDAAVDFTRPDAVRGNVEACLGAGVPCIVGTTGLGPADLAAFDELAREKGIACFVAPNFAIGAVLMMRFAGQAARYMPSAEIVELHHETKVGRTVGNREGDRGSHPGRRPDPFGSPAGPRRAPGGALRWRRTAPDDPPRHALPRGVRAGSPPGAGAAFEPRAGRHGGARKPPGVRCVRCSAKS